MSLPPQAQSLVDQLVQVLGLQALPLESLEIHFDRERIVQAVKPQLNFRRREKVPCPRLESLSWRSR